MLTLEPYSRPPTPLSTTADLSAAGDPARTFYRITRKEHPGLFPPPDGRARFDDPRGEYRVLYGALERAASFAESLQQFRPDMATRAAIAALTFRVVPESPVRLRTWAGARVILTLRLARAARLCDLRSSVDLERAADGISPQAKALGLTDFDASQVTGQDRSVTRAVSRWAYEHEYDGLLYPSRLGTEWNCCAIFDKVRPRVMARASISVDDADLVAVCGAFGIRITG